MAKLLISTAIFLCSFICTGNSQSNDIEFLIKMIKTGYAGYGDRTNGNEKKFDNFIQQVIKEEKSDTFRILARIVSYFDDPHLQIYANNPIKKISVDSTSCTRKFHELSSYLSDSIVRKERFEGYWINDMKTTIIAIIKESRNSQSYKIHFVSSKTSLVPPGFCIGRINDFANGRYLTDFLSPRGGARFLLRSVFKNDSTFITGDIATWNKMSYIRPDLPEAPTVRKTFEISGKLLDKDNYLLTLPDFTAPNIPLVDSLIKADYYKIKNAKTLILDVRNNIGGTVRTYAPIVPLVSTQPIIALSGYKYCSPVLLEHRRDQIAELLTNAPIDSSLLFELMKDSTKVFRNLGKFVFEPGDTLQFDSVMSMPQNVAIITNFSVQSAGEMMVLDFKQSKKVKVFGEATMGAVDYLDAFLIQLPSRNFTMSLASFKTFRSPGQRRIDFTGIKPDVEISAQNSDWVEYIRKYYD
jgi:hypothetical protein